VQKGNDILVKTSAVIDNPKCSFRWFSNFW
jgi:hypothetical protein